MVGSYLSLLSRTLRTDVSSGGRSSSPASPPTFSREPTAANVDTDPAEATRTLRSQPDTSPNAHMDQIHQSNPCGDNMKRNKRSFKHLIDGGPLLDNLRALSTVMINMPGILLLCQCKLKKSKLRTVIVEDYAVLAPCLKNHKL